MPPSASGGGSAAESAAAGDPYTSQGRYVPGQAANASFLPNSTQPADKKRPRSQFVPLPALYLFNAKAGEKAVETLRSANAQASPELQLEEPLVSWRKWDKLMFAAKNTGPYSLKTNAYTL